MDLGPPESLPIIVLNHDLYDIFLGGGGGGHIYEIYESYLLNKQGFQGFMSKQREHITLKYCVFGQKELCTVPG